MNRYDRFKLEILQRAERAQDFTGVQTFQLAAQYEIEEKFVREILAALHAEQLIRLSAWDGKSRDLPFDEWQDPDYFFNFASDNSNKRIRLRVKGAEVLENLLSQQPEPAPKTAIGFAASGD